MGHTMARVKGALVRAALVLSLVALALAGTVGSAAAQWTMNVGHQTANDYQDELAELFVQLTEELTGGRVKGYVFNAASLGPAAQQNEALRHGIQEAVIGPTGLVTAIVPEVGVLDLPFLFENDREQIVVLNGRGGDPFREAAEQRDLVILAFIPGGFRDFATSFPFRTVEDLRGRRIRVIESPELIGMAESWGAIGIPMPFPEVYTGLQHGTVHGLDNAPDTIAALRFFEPAPYYTITRHGSWSTVIMVSKIWFYSLPEDVREQVRQAALQVAERSEEMRVPWVEWALETVSSRGAEVTTLPEAEREKMRELALSNVWQKILADPVKGPILEHLTRELEAYRAAR